MSVEVILLLGLLAIFVVPVATNLNVGLVALVVAALLGSTVLGLDPRSILAGFPARMFVLIVGITLLLAIAQQNGTTDWIVNTLMGLAKGRLILLPWLLFVTAFITSSLGPGAAPVLFVIGAGLLARFQLNPLLIAAMVIHGTQSGAYSPIAPYGIVISQLAVDQAISYSPWSVYAGVVAFHVVLAGLAFFALGGLKLKGEFYDSAPVSVDINEAPALFRYLTLAGFCALLVAMIGFGIDLGFAAMGISLVLLSLSSRQLRTDSINRVAWPIVLVICGVLTYVSLIQEAGAINWLAAQAEVIGSATTVGLLLCYLVSIITGVASTIGTIGMLVPLSAPLITSGAIDGTGLITAMAVSAAISDISPFSTWGALFLASVASVTDRDQLLRKQMLYTLVLVTTLPCVAWLLFVVIGIAPG